MSSPALIAHASPDGIIAYRAGVPVRAATFLAHVHALVDDLPPAGHVLNACQDRYLFAVGVAAAMLRGSVSLLPPSQTPEMLAALQRFAPDVYCLHDGGAGDVALPAHRVRLGDAADWTGPIPTLPSEQVVACAFTSGSTGQPAPHLKRWGALVRNVQAEARRLAVTPDHAVVATVPAQHMYGFESSLMVALQAGAAFCAERPFYAGDIVAALERLPRRRVLVTTPFHLRNLLDAGLTMPPVDRVVSATAPLSPALAARAEAAFAAPLLEIYGATETGQLATRRSTESPVWTTFDGVTLHHAGNGQVLASGNHIETPTALSDVIECESATRFILHGRSADLINIAGKRTSLGYLNHQLAAVPGVIDSCFFMPDEEDCDGVTRLAAFVVAPGSTPQEITSALRARIDPIFLPRPLIMLDALPRNATGKLPRDALTALVRMHAPGRAGGSGA